MFNEKEVEYYDVFRGRLACLDEAREIKKRFFKARTVLDIGCGTGMVGEELEEMGCKVTGVEPSWAMYKKAVKRMSGCYPIPIQLFPSFPELMEDKFDLAIGLYDVMNYIPHKDLAGVMDTIHQAAKESYLPMWDPSKRVKLITFKKKHDCSRLRFAIRIFGRVFVWFVYWGRGLCFSFPKLYLHR